MTWAAVAGGTIAAVGSVGSALISRGGGGGGGAGNLEDVQSWLDQYLPNWQEDPYYKKTQDQLYSQGTDLMSGNIPEYYKPIGEYGSKEFEDLMRLVERDTTRNVQETAARRGQTGGNVDTAVAKAVADARAPLAYQDMVRALSGREMFLKTGDALVSDVRQGALTNQGQQNQFNISRAGIALNALTGGANTQNTSSAANAAQYSDILSSIGGGVGTLAGWFNKSQDQGSTTSQYADALTLMGSVNGNDFADYKYGTTPKLGSAELDKLTQLRY